MRKLLGKTTFSKPCEVLELVLTFGAFEILRLQPNVLKIQVQLNDQFCKTENFVFKGSQLLKTFFNFCFNLVLF